MMLSSSYSADITTKQSYNSLKKVPDFKSGTFLCEG